jgi:hypothetical protein
MAAWVALGAGCGDDTATPTDASPPDEVPDPTLERRYRTHGVVIDHGDDRPVLCLTAEPGDPPTCGYSIELDGWSWDRAGVDERPGSPRWGLYDVVGTWDGSRLGVVEAEPGDRWPDHATNLWPDRRTECSEPPRGWFADVDDGRVDTWASEALDEYLLSQPDFVDLWLDSSPHPDFPDFPPGRPLPGESVLNVRFVRDATAHAAAIREIWGGPICLSEGGLPHIEIEQLRDRAVAELDGVIAASTDPVGGYVQVVVVVAALDQGELDRQYGTGRVRLVGALQPAPVESGG